jgi:hypothetical protein
MINFSLNHYVGGPSVYELCERFHHLARTNCSASRRHLIPLNNARIYQIYPSEFTESENKVSEIKIQNESRKIKKKMWQTEQN